MVPFCYTVFRIVMKPEDIFFCSLMTGPTVLPDLSIVKNFFALSKGTLANVVAFAGALAILLTILVDP